MVSSVCYANDGRSSSNAGNVKAYHDILLIHEDVVKGSTREYHDAYKPLDDWANMTEKNVHGRSGVTDCHPGELRVAGRTQQERGASGFVNTSPAISQCQRGDY